LALQQNRIAAFGLAAVKSMILKEKDFCCLLKKLLADYS